MTGIQRGLSALDESGLPAYIRAAYGVDRSWMVEAECSSTRRNGTLEWWWKIGPGERRAGQAGRKWIEMAERVCVGCRAQYDCLRYAITVNEYYTWALSEEHRKELLNLPNYERYIDAAEATETPLLVMLERLQESRRGRLQAPFQRSTSTR